MEYLFVSVIYIYSKLARAYSKIDTIFNDEIRVKRDEFTSRKDLHVLALMFLHNKLKFGFISQCKTK